MAKAIRFETHQIREQGRDTSGVTGIKFKELNDFVVDAIILKSEKDEVLTISENGLGKRSFISDYRLTNRAGIGVISMKLTNRTGKRVIGAVTVEEDKDLMILTESGKIIRISFDDIGITNRNTSGVTLIRGDKVLAVSKSPKDKIDERENSTVENSLI